MARIDPASRDLVMRVSGDLEREASPMVQAMYLRIVTHRGSRFWDPSFGSTLHLIKKITATTHVRIEDAIRQALRPMVDAREITAPTFTHEHPTPSRWHVQVDATDSRRAPVSLSLFVGVGE